MGSSLVLSVWYQLQGLAEYEAINMFRNGQVPYTAKNDVLAQKQLIENSFQLQKYKFFLLG
jgi:hypothetical protein